MTASVYVLIAALALSTMFAGVGQKANALGKHHSSLPRLERKAKKNSSPYAYLAPKKQKKPSGYYQSTLTGKLVYGKKKK